MARTRASRGAVGEKHDCHRNIRPSLSKYDLKPAFATLTQWRSRTMEASALVSDKPGAFDRSTQRHLSAHEFKHGVYDPRKMAETGAYSESRHLDTLESPEMARQRWPPHGWGRPVSRFVRANGLRPPALPQKTAAKRWQATRRRQPRERYAEAWRSSYMLCCRSFNAKESLSSRHRRTRYITTQEAGPRHHRQPPRR